MRMEDTQLTRVSISGLVFPIQGQAHWPDGDRFRSESHASSKPSYVMSSKKGKSEKARV